LRLRLNEEEQVGSKLEKVLAMSVICLAVSKTGAVQESQPKTGCIDPEYLHFDFWIGSWRVSDSEGNFQGTNRIEKTLDGCALQESWSGSGTRGHSCNAYSKNPGLWHQTWVDNNGSLLPLDGGLVDGRMVLTGQTPAAYGKGTADHEISWEALPDGCVLQVWKVSTDGGGSWKEVFRGIYTRDRK
jgi:hypothetical protein